MLWGICWLASLLMHSQARQRKLGYFWMPAYWLACITEQAILFVRWFQLNGQLLATAACVDNLLMKAAMSLILSIKPWLQFSHVRGCQRQLRFEWPKCHRQTLNTRVCADASMPACSLWPRGPVHEEFALRCTNYTCTSRWTSKCDGNDFSAEVAA